MATFRNLLGIICLVVFGQFIEPNSDFLRREGRKVENGKVGRWGDGKVANHHLITLTTHQLNNSPTQLPSSTILRIAQSQLGVREATGKNDGKEVEAYLGYTGNKKGDPWCASFVSWVYGKAGFATPKTAWSPSLFPIARLVSDPQAADVFGIYFPKLKRIAHCGIVVRSKGNWIYSIEGNTNLAGSREGDGVYRKLRHKHTIKYYSNWIGDIRGIGL